MSYNDIFGDGEVFGAMITVGIICAALLAPNMALAFRKISRKIRTKE
jgi:hypothetical protein